VDGVETGDYDRDQDLEEGQWYPSVVEKSDKKIRYLVVVEAKGVWTMKHERTGYSCFSIKDD
jgi:hypothetical protein